MKVVVANNVPARLRGQLATWLFVDEYSARTRDMIWEHVTVYIEQRRAATD
jgi:CRISPR-associated endoribonuclease Cas2 subtype I-E